MTVSIQDTIEFNWLQVVTSVFQNILPDKIWNNWLQFFRVPFPHISIYYFITILIFVQ